MKRKKNAKLYIKHELLHEFVKIAKKIMTPQRFSEVEIWHHIF